MSMRIATFVILAMLCCGCRASTVRSAIANPVKIQTAEYFFDGGTVALEFVGRDASTVKVYLQPAYPGWRTAIGQPFFLDGHPEINGTEVKVGSPDEVAIVNALKKFHGDSETAKWVQVFLEAARKEDYLAAHPEMLQRRQALVESLRAAGDAYTKLQMAAIPEDETERRKWDEESNEAKVARAEQFGHWDEFDGMIKLLAQK